MLIRRLAEIFVPQCWDFFNQFQAFGILAFDVVAYSVISHTVVINNDVGFLLGGVVNLIATN